MHAKTLLLISLLLTVMAKAQPTICNSVETKFLIEQWNFSKKLPNSYWKKPLTFENQHPAAQSPKFFFVPPNWKSWKNDTVGLPLIVFTDHPGQHFKKITEHSFLCNLQPATMVLEKKHQSYHAVLYDPRVTQEHAGQSLATKEGLIIDYFRLHPKTLGLNLTGFFQPKKHAPKRGLYLAAPYDAEKIPLLMIHGVASSPAAFKELSYAIESDPYLASTYQLWYYYYPSGSPWILSAAEFRRDLREFLTTVDPDQQSPHSSNICLIAHSMGGLISRLSCSEPKQHLAGAFLKRPLHDMNLSKADEALLQEAFHYSPLTSVSRIIFAAVPHRGSHIASGAIKWACENTVKLATPTNTLRKNTLSPDALASLGPKDVSVTQLEPQHLGLKALANMPIRSGLLCHSLQGSLPLINKDTDGVVPHSSSFFSPSISTHTSSTGHSLVNHPHAIKEILRILHLHTKDSPN